MRNNVLSLIRGIIRQCIYGMPYTSFTLFIFKFKQSKVLLHCSKEKNEKRKKWDRNRMQELMATIYFMNYKSTVASVKKVASLPRANGRVCERRGRKVLKTFRDRTRLLREAKPCSIIGLRAFPPPVCFFAIYPSWVPFFTSSHFRPQNFAKKKTILEFIRKSNRDVVFLFLSLCVTLGSYLTNQNGTHYEFFSNGCLNEKFDRFL